MASADGSSTEDITSLGFDPTARLNVYKFKTAATSHGNLHLSVVYDGNAAQWIDKEREAAQAPSRELVEPTLHYPTEMSQINHDGSNASPPDPWTRTNAPPAQSNMIPRTSTGSPFPSPSTTKRMLAFLSEKSRKLSAQHPSSSSCTQASSVRGKEFKDARERTFLFKSQSREDLIVDPLHEQSLEGMRSSPVSIPNSPNVKNAGRIDSQIQKDQDLLGLNISVRPTDSLSSDPVEESVLYEHTLPTSASISSELFGSLVGSYEVISL